MSAPARPLFFERPGLGPCPPPDRGIIGVTRGPRDLSFPRDTPSGQTWIYQLAFPFQLSATHAGLCVNIRVGSNRIIDLEAGSDVIVFNRVEGIPAGKATPTFRVYEAPHPRTGERLYMVSLSIAAFVPLGARRPDGTPHPHAGTGFDCAIVGGYPVALGDQPDTHIDFNDDFHSFLRIQQFAFDGRDFHVTETLELPHEELLPGFRIVEHGFSNPVASGDDLLFPISHGTILDSVSGLSRWRRGSNGRWWPVSFCPIFDHATEATVVRDLDGSLLMTARPAIIPNNPRPAAVDVYRSTDEGETWERVIQMEKFCFGSPVFLNRAADGTPYLVTCRYREPPAHKFAKREALWLWPLADDRRSIQDPIIVRDGPAEFGPAPHGTPWRMDHPFGCTVRLADGEWRHLLGYRVLEDAEMRTNAGPTPFTGSYIEEVCSAGPAVPLWRF